MLKSLAVLAAATALIVPPAQAAGLSPNLSIHVSGPTTHLPSGRIDVGHATYTPPPSSGGLGLDHRGTTHFDANHQFDDVGSVSASNKGLK